MAEGGGSGMLYFIVGALCIVVAVGGFLVFGGGFSTAQPSKTVDVKIAVPNVEKK